MFNKIYLICVLALFFAGCSGTGTPQIIGQAPDPYVFHESSEDFIDVEPPKPISSVPYAWIPGVTEREWTAIVIHHSASDHGDADTFDSWHKQRGWLGVGYDFVIGNGTGSANGQIEVTFRWTQQRTGAHVGGTPGNWANRQAVGICLVGNFSKITPSSAQLNSLRKLVRFLMVRYDIPESRIYGHREVPGAHATDCPGKRFSMDWFRKSL